MKLIKNGKIYTITQGTFKGSVLIRDGCIEEIGKDIDVPDSANVIDVEEKTVIPGLVEAHCHSGLMEEAEGQEGNDANEKYDPITPHLRALDGINPFDVGLQNAVRAGITTVNVGPGSANPIGGKFAALKTAGSENIKDLILREPTGIKMATGENPKRTYREQEKIPSTRIGTAGLVRKTLFEAENYLQKVGNSEKVEKDFKLESLRPLLSGEIKARIHAHRADDIETAVRIGEEFDLDVVIEHCTEGHRIADYLAEKDIPAIVGPSLSSRYKREVKERTFKTAGILSKKGVKVAIMTDSPVVPIQFLALMAAYSVREGMERKEALKSITINPAEICGIDDRVGSLEKGKDADIVVLDGDPLDLKSKVERVYIEGKEIDITGLPNQGDIRTF